MEIRTKEINDEYQRRRHDDMEEDPMSLLSNLEQPWIADELIDMLPESADAAVYSKQHQHHDSYQTASTLSRRNSNVSNTMTMDKEMNEYGKSYSHLTKHGIAGEGSNIGIKRDVSTLNVSEYNPANVSRSTSMNLLPPHRRMRLNLELMAMDNQIMELAMSSNSIKESLLASSSDYSNLLLSSASSQLFDTKVHDSHHTNTMRRCMADLMNCIRHDSDMTKSSTSYESRSLDELESELEKELYSILKDRQRQ